jgi:DNA-binding Lrp family transcriptional regulator
MKKVLVTLVIVGAIIATFTFIVNRNRLPYKPEKAVIVDVDVESNEAKPNEKWVRYTYWAEDTSEALRQAKAGVDFHLDKGETVSELIETTNKEGNRIYYFKVKAE